MTGSGGLKSQEGITAAREWRARHHPIAATEPYPFVTHRNCAEWGPDDHGGGSLLAKSQHGEGVHGQCAGVVQ